MTNQQGGPTDARTVSPAGETAHQDTPGAGQPDHAGAAPQGDGQDVGSQAATPPATPPGSQPAAGQEIGREGESDREGKGGYGNDTGFTGGTAGSRD